MGLGITLRVELRGRVRVELRGCIRAKVGWGQR